MVPAWLEVALRTAPWCITQIHHKLSPCLLILEGFSSGIPPEGMQHQPGAPWGLGIPGKGMGLHVSRMAKGSRKAPMPSPTAALRSSGRMMP